MDANSSPNGFDDLPRRGLISTRKIAARLGYAHAASLRRFCTEHHCPLPRPVRQGWYRTGDIVDWFDRLGEVSVSDTDDDETNVVDLAAIRIRMTENTR